MNDDERPDERSKKQDNQRVSWQAQKSAATRKLIIEATIQCFVDLGYGRTTTMRIAQAAGLSRGAMLHHFPSKIDIVKAAVEELHAKRLKAFRTSVIQAPPAGKGRVHVAVQAYWQHVRHPTFVAFFELSVAARTDSELEAILKPAQAAFDEEWYRTATEAFPEWQSDPVAFDLALDLSRYLLEGMAVSFLTHEESEREQHVLDYLEDQLRALRPGPTPLAAPGSQGPRTGKR
jgi:AcrR family transcriptional regulator